MKISNFVKNLLPFFARSRVQEDLRNVNTELQTMVLPALKAVSQELRSPFKNQEAKYFQAAYKMSVRGSGNANYLEDLNHRAPKFLIVLDALTTVINTEFEDKILSAGLNVKKTNCIRILGVLGFMNKYIMSLINVTLHYELIERGLSMPYVSDVTPGELIRLKKYLPDFLQFLESVTSVKDPVKAFSEIADVLASAEDFSEVFGETKMDPFRVFGASGFKGSPFYMAGMIVAEFQNKQYKKMESQKQAIEKRLIAIRRMANGQSSPEVEKELEILTSRIASISEDLRKYEESLA